MKDKFSGTSKATPIFDIELQIAKKSEEKLSSRLSKIKKIEIKKKR